MRAIDECAALTRTRGGKQRGMKRNEETFHCEPAEASMLLLLLFHALLFFFQSCLPRCFTSKRDLEFKIVPLCSASHGLISLQACSTCVIQWVSGECLAKFLGLGTGVTHERIKLIRCDQREGWEEAVILLHQHDTSPCFPLAPLRQVTGRWGDLGRALFGQRHRGTQCENQKPKNKTNKKKTGRLWWCARDSLQTGSSRYHSSAHSTAEDSTGEKKKNPSWHPCLESSSVDKKTSKKTFFFFFFWEWPHSHKKKNGFKNVEVDAITCTSVHLLYIESLLPGVSLVLTSARGSVMLHLVAFKCCGKNVTACNSGSTRVDKNSNLLLMGC